VRKHTATQDFFDLEGWCEVCAARTAFRVDKHSGGEERPDGTWIPNWRERLVCHSCQLNTRQRVIVARLRDLIRGKEAGADIYLTEQVTPLFQRLAYSIAGSRWTGSEYLGPDVAPGAINPGGIRHEDVERLSFEEARFDIVVSNDVLEHVNDPSQALREICRVLRPGGTLLLTVPFHTGLETTVRRASIGPQGLVHHLPEVYHGNPISDEGSLVFNDFGWDFLDEMANAGFADVALHVYWAERFGYLGVGQHYIMAVKPA